MVNRGRALGEDGKWVNAPGVRRFVLHRTEDISGTSGVGEVAEGVRFTDGTVALRWTVELKSTAIYDSMDDLVKIHGHGGATTVEWTDT
jgi:hypothetical protein